MRNLHAITMICALLTFHWNTSAREATRTPPAVRPVQEDPEKKKDDIEKEANAEKEDKIEKAKKADKADETENEDEEESEEDFFSGGTMETDTDIGRTGTGIVLGHMALDAGVTVEKRTGTQWAGRSGEAPSMAVGACWRSAWTLNGRGEDGLKEERHARLLSRSGPQLCLRLILSCGKPFDKPVHFIA